jgi:hypothetical protein
MVVARRIIATRSATPAIGFECELESPEINVNYSGMSNLRSIDMRLVDEVFEMGGGYVLDFSDRTFREFFADEMDVDIDDPVYSKEGTSKAKRLRCFLRTVDDRNAAKTLKNLWQHRQVLRERRGDKPEGPTVQGRFLQLIDKLEGKAATAHPPGVTPVPAFGVEKFQSFKERGPHPV